MKKHILEIDVTDWMKETKDADPQAEDFHGFIEEGVERGWSTVQQARYAWCKQRLAKAMKPIYEVADKAFLALGLRTKWGRKARSYLRETTISIPDPDDPEKNMSIPRYIGLPGSVNGRAKGYIPTTHRYASERAQKTLRGSVRTRLRNLLLIIAENGDDVGGEWEHLVGWGNQLIKDIKAGS